MQPIDWFLNLTYVAYVVAPAIKNELWLRVLLMINALGFATWGLLIGNLSVVFWNVVFAGISAYGIVRLLRERREVPLPEGLAAIRDHLFKGVSNRNFLLFWSLGESADMADGKLTTHGEPVDRLHLLIDGGARVIADGVEVAELGPHQFVGEMAFVSGECASATVAIDRPCTVHSWAFSDLETLHTLEPQLSLPLLSSINRDLANKLKV
ncbi:MAG: cyclic nucleotide-binding domain-containing protein [Acidimicrobiia bacterium]|nr:cyclic nucleotide-binding domain-containing protein [Acidimicrobiia bacterium]